MIMMQITVKKTANEKYEFSFYRNEAAGHLDEERSAIAMMLGEATDALLRLPQRIESEQLNSSSPVHRIKITVGADAINQ